MQLLGIDDLTGVQEWLRHPRVDVLERNVELVRPHCSIQDLPERLGAVLRARGWDTW